MSYHFYISMSQHAVEGGKLHLAEALFERHRFKIRCPHCPGTLGKPGFNKDSAGKPDPSGLSRRQWSCNRSNSRDVRRSGQKACPRTTVSEFILLAQKALDPSDFSATVDHVCSRYPPSEERYLGLQVYSVTHQAPVLRLTEHASSSSSSWSSPRPAPDASSHTTEPSSDLPEPGCTTAQDERLIIPETSPPPPYLPSDPPEHQPSVSPPPPNTSSPPPALHPPVTPGNPRKRRAESEPAVQCPDVKRPLLAARLRNESLRTKELLRLGIQQLEPLLDLARLWKEAYARFTDKDDLPEPRLTPLLAPTSSTLVPSTSPIARAKLDVRHILDEPPTGKRRGYTRRRNRRSATSLVPSTSTLDKFLQVPSSIQP